MMFFWIFVDRIWSPNFHRNGSEFDCMQEPAFGPYLSHPLSCDRRNSLYFGPASTNAADPSNELSFMESARLALPSSTASINSHTSDHETQAKNHSDQDQQLSLLHDNFTSKDIKRRNLRQYYPQQQPPTTTIAWGTYFTPSISHFNWGTANGGIHTSPLRRKLRFVLYQVFVFLLVSFLCLIITNSLKNVVGRLRPDFLHRCQPNYDIVPPDPIYHYISAEDSARVCTGDPNVITEGRKSFPSGHSSASMTGGLWMSLYVFKRAWYRGKRYFGMAIIPIVMTMTTLMALLIAASRHFDGRHHPLDIIIGLTIGALSTFIALPLEPFTPSWEVDGSLYDPEGKPQHLFSQIQDGGGDLSSSLEPTEDVTYD